jgi:hypothetical protein
VVVAEKGSSLLQGFVFKPLQPGPDSIQRNFRIRCHCEEFGQLRAGVFITVSAVRQALIQPALPNFTDTAMLEEQPTFRSTSVAIYITGLKVSAEFL